MVFMHRRFQNHEFKNVTVNVLKLIFFKRR